VPPTDSDCWTVWLFCKVSESSAWTNWVHCRRLLHLHSSLPVVHAIGATPPYSALAVDALRDELAGVQDKVQALDSGLSARESEKQILVEQLRRADEALRWQLID
jgi:hypothetical protein